MGYASGADGLKKKIFEAQVRSLPEEKKAALRAYFDGWQVDGKLECDCPDLMCQQAQELHRQEAEMDAPDEAPTLKAAALAESQQRLVAVTKAAAPFMGSAKWATEATVEGIMSGATEVWVDGKPYFLSKTQAELFRHVTLALAEGRWSSFATTGTYEVTVYLKP